MTKLLLKKKKVPYLIYLLGSKVSAGQINKKINQYVSEYVLCHNHECRKPDTELIVKKGVTYIKCKACGSEYPVKG